MKLDSVEFGIDEFTHKLDKIFLKFLRTTIRVFKSWDYEPNGLPSKAQLGHRTFAIAAISLKSQSL